MATPDRRKPSGVRMEQPRWTIGVASVYEVDGVLAVLNNAAAWLRASGSDQWAGGFGPERIARTVRGGEVLLVRDAGRSVATLTASPSGDADFWSPEELAEPAIYLSKIAVVRSHAGRGLGRLVISWAVDQAARAGYSRVRLDAWRSNRELHKLYERYGWQYLRTVAPEQRQSGALFTRRAVADAPARRALEVVPGLTPKMELSSCDARTAEVEDELGAVH